MVTPSDFIVPPAVRGWANRSRIPSAVPEDTELTAGELQQFETAVMNDQVLRQEAAAIAEQARALQGEGAPPAGQLSRHTWMSPSVVAEMQTPGGEGSLVSFAVLRIARGCIAAIVKVIERYATRRDHGFHRTIVEEILREFYLANAGKFLWDGMKNAIESSFSGSPDDCGGAAFLEGLLRIWEAGHRPQLFLVGHSAGSIYIAKFLAHAAGKLPHDMKFGLLLVNPAATFPPMADAAGKTAAHLTGARLFAMGTTREGQEPLVHSAPFVYPGDLLYLVSGILEDEPDTPLVGMQRFYSGLAPFTQDRYPAIFKVDANSFLGAAHGLLWSQTTQTGFECDLKSHGNFHADKQTVDGIVHILKNGF
jgi:hypothetical protein